MTRFHDIQAATKVGRRLQDKPDWAVTACGCCDGLQWSAGTEPIECRDCAGGSVYVHLPTGTVAMWPGGPFNGDKRTDLDIAEVP